MTQNRELPEPAFSAKALAAACVVFARYLQARDPQFLVFLTASLRHAEAAGLPEADVRLLTFLRDVLGAAKPPADAAPPSG